MQKAATRTFTIASLLFGIVGLTMVMLASDQGGDNSGSFSILIRLLMASVFVILPSFAVSIACKYLGLR